MEDSRIEVEVRSFISEEEFKKLLEFFKANAKFICEDFQETHYFKGNFDLRIQKNNFFSKIWLKTGKIHDELREEIEIIFKREDFEKLEKLLGMLGFEVEIKWFRHRYQFDWNGVGVYLDYTKGYGYIIELEKKEVRENAEETLNKLKEMLQGLGVRITPREEFDKKFQYYKENWKNLIDGKDRFIN